MTDSDAWSDNTTLTFPAETFEIKEGTGPKLEAHIEPPQSIRPNRKYTVWLEYSNIGDSDMPAPLLITDSNCSISLDKENITGDQVQILGLGSAVPNILSIGESKRIPFYFISPGAGGKATFNLSVAKEVSETIDWNVQKTNMLLTDMSEQEWNALIARLGATWTQYLEILRNNALKLKQQGTEVYDVRELILQEVKQIRGESIAAISGVLRDKDTGVLLSGVPVKVRNADGSVLKQANTKYTPEGHFVIDGLADGDYEVLLEGYYFEEPVTVTVKDGKDVNNLVYFGKKISTEEPEPEIVEIPDHNPAIVSDESGKLYTVWEHGNEIWWAINEGGAWKKYGKISDSEGSNPALVIDLEGFGNLQGLTLLSAYESGLSPKIIQWTVGKPDAEKGLVWSEIQSLTGDNYDDFGIALVMTEDHQPLILWLQADTSVTDDSDLYYQVYDLSGFIFNQIQEKNFDFVLTKSSGWTECYKFSWPRDIRVKASVYLMEYLFSEAITVFMPMENFVEMGLAIKVNQVKSV